MDGKTTEKGGIVIEPYVYALTYQIPHLLEDLVWMQEEQSTLFAIAGLELKLEGLAAVVRESGKEVASAVGPWLCLWWVWGGIPQLPAAVKRRGPLG